MMTDIHYVEVMLVDRKNLLNYLETRYGINEETAKRKSDEIVKSGESGALEVLGDDSESRYHYSIGLKERPVNIVIRKNELLKEGLVEKHFIVKRAGLLDCMKTQTNTR